MPIPSILPCKFVGCIFSSASLNRKRDVGRHELRCLFNPVNIPARTQPSGHSDGSEPEHSVMIAATDGGASVQPPNATRHRNDMIVLLRERLSDPELLMFMESMYGYTQHDASVDMVVDLDHVVRYVGTPKSDLFRILAGARRTGEFVEDIDFKVTQIPNENNTGVGRQFNRVLLTPNAFKKLCLALNTPKSAQIREYFVKMETIVLEYTSGALNLPTRNATTATTPTPASDTAGVRPSTVATPRPASRALATRPRYDVSTFATDTACVHEHLPLSFRTANLAYLMNMGVFDNTAFMSAGLTHRGAQRRTEHDYRIPSSLVEVYISTGKSSPIPVEKAIMAHPKAKARSVDVYVNGVKRLGVFGYRQDEKDDVVAEIIEDVSEECSDIIEEIRYKGVTRKFERKARADLERQLEIEKEKTEQIKAQMRSMTQLDLDIVKERAKIVKERAKIETEKAKIEIEKTKQLTLQIELEKLRMAQASRST